VNSTSNPVLPLRFHDTGAPRLTQALATIEVSESDQYLHGIIPHGDRNAPHRTNAWDRGFVFTPKLGDRNISDLCGL